MADYPISNVDRRVQYVNSGVGPYLFSFEVLVETDIAVYRGSTLLTLTSDYTVTINTNGTGSVTLTTGGTGIITIVGARAIERTTDFTTGGDLFANVLNQGLDSQTIFSQQLAESLDRTIRVPEYTASTVGLEVNPVGDKLLGWDSTGQNLINIDPTDLVNFTFNSATSFVDVFIGDGSETQYTLSNSPGTLYNLDISIDGVTQEPGRDYTLSLDVVTFTSAVPDNSRILIKYTQALLNVSGDSQDIRYLPAGTGAVATTVQTKLRETVSVKDFGAVGDGVADDTLAIQAAIDYAETIVYNGFSDIDIVTASVYIPPGIYKTTSAIILKNCVSITGASSGSTNILVSHAGNGFQSTAGGTYANIYISNLNIRNAGTAQNGIYHEGMIRNCVDTNVICDGFVNGFYFTNTWTTVLQNCCAYNSTGSHIYCTTGSGEIVVRGGRYDVATSYGVYFNSVSGELVMTNANVQFGQSSAVYVENARTVELKQCFFEGNCIGNPARYYVELTNASSLALSSAVVNDCVMNNLSDSNRNGLGVCYVKNYQTFNYRERWARNGVSVVPVVDTGVFTTDVDINSSNSRASVLTNIAVGSQNHAMIRQNARPTGIFGQDMADTSFAPTTRAALNVGFNSVGVAIGTYDNHPALNGYGDSNKLKLNPALGDIYFGQTDLATLENGTNEFYGRYREITQASASSITPNATTGFVVVDASGTSKVVTLTNILGAYGRRITIAKSDGGSNTLTVTPAAGETINGAANWTSTAAYASVSLIGINGGWVVV